MKKTRKTVIIVAATVAAIGLTASGLAPSKSWIVVNDSCKKCKVVNDIPYCGKCGYNMSSQNEYKNGYLYSTGTCLSEKCKHTSTFKKKY